MINSTHGIIDFTNQIERVTRFTAPAKNREIVWILGDTGSGKSTLSNWLAGCQNFRTEGDSPLFQRIVCNNPIFEIGHGSTSKTTYPKVHFDPASQLTICDCPGSKDNRGFIQDAINGFSLAQTTKESAMIKCAILCVEYAAIIAARQEGLKQSIDRALGMAGQLVKADTVFLMITKAVNPSNQHIFEPVKEMEFLTKHNTFIASLEKVGNVGFYSPLNILKEGNYVFSAQKLINKIRSFTPLPSRAIHISSFLETETINKIVDLISDANELADINIKEQDYASLKKLLNALELLGILKDCPQIIKSIDTFEKRLIARIELIQTEDQAEEKLKQLQGVIPNGNAPRFSEIFGRVFKKLEEKKATEKLTGELQLKIARMQREAADMQRQMANMNAQVSNETERLRSENRTLRQKNQELSDMENKNRQMSYEIERLNNENSALRIKNQELINVSLQLVPYAVFGRR